jgi:hypothetical protein
MVVRSLDFILDYATRFCRSLLPEVAFILEHRGSRFSIQCHNPEEHNLEIVSISFAFHLSHSLRGGGLNFGNTKMSPSVKTKLI